MGSSTANFTLDGHEKGVNCVDYYHGGDKPYLISGADDRTVRVWDYQNKTCVQVLDGTIEITSMKYIYIFLQFYLHCSIFISGHTQNVSAVSFHPELPILITGSEDGTVKIWHAGTYRYRILNFVVILIDVNSKKLHL